MSCDEWDGFVHHMTDIDNLFGILRFGILSKHDAQERGVVRVNISDSEIQDRREELTVGDKTLHDFASFYLNPRNAMLYRTAVKERRHVVVIAVDQSAYEGTDSIVTTRNAAADKAEWLPLDQMMDLDWDTIFSDEWAGDRDVMQIMQAELLVPDAVSPRAIRRIICKHEWDARRVQGICNRMRRADIEVRTYDWLFFKH